MGFFQSSTKEVVQNRPQKSIISLSIIKKLLIILVSLGLTVGLVKAIHAHKVQQRYENYSPSQKAVYDFCVQLNKFYQSRNTPLQYNCTEEAARVKVLPKR